MSTFDEYAHMLSYLDTTFTLAPLRDLVVGLAERSDADMLVECPTRKECNHPEGPCPVCGGYKLVPVSRWRRWMLTEIDRKMQPKPEPFTQSFNEDGIPF